MGIKREPAKIFSIVLRYFLLLIAGLNIWVFYVLFAPLTIYPAFFLLNIFYDASFSGANLILGSFYIQLADACIAGSAYYLLLALNLATPMPIKKRMFSLLFTFLSFLIINILRISFFSVLFINSFSLFNILHLIFWYFISAVFVFAIWFVNVKLFKIQDIPVYSDFKLLFKIIKRKSS